MNPYKQYQKAALGLSCLASTLVAMNALAGPAPTPASMPNILLVITDDQGYGDLSLHGNPFLQTPHLDAFARQSVRFEQFLATPTCSPTRVALLTGRHEFNSSVTHTISGRYLIATDSPALPQVLKEAGYTTGIFGKWHLGDNFPYRPEDRGFDQVLIYQAGGIGQTPDFWGNRYDDPFLLENGEWRQFKGFCTEVFFRQAEDWIGKQAQPWFAMIALNAPHTPLQIARKWSEPFTEMGLRETVARFYGLVANLDHHFGETMQWLESKGLDKNTIVIFMGDNGSAMGGDAREGDFNAGLRGFKASAYQGGSRVPFFIRWGDRFAPNQKVDALAGVGDVFPTLLELIGIPEAMPAALEGRSLAALLDDPDATWENRFMYTHLGRWHGDADPRDYIFNRSSIRDARYSLVEGRELYDLLNDRGETADIAAEKPAEVERLKQAYVTWWNNTLPALSTVHPVAVLGGPQARVELTCVDWLPSLAVPGTRLIYFWRQESLETLARGNPWDNAYGTAGHWRLRARAEGLYRITLRKLPPEADPALAAFNAGAVTLHIDERRLYGEIPKGAREVVFETVLPAGDFTLEAVLHNQTPDGSPIGAYFATLDSLNP